VTYLHDMYRTHIDATRDDTSSHMFEWAVGDVDHAVRPHRRLDERAIMLGQRASEIGATLCEAVGDIGMDVDFDVKDVGRIVEVTVEDPTSSASRKQLVTIVRRIVETARKFGCSTLSTVVTEDVGARVIVATNT
jgi:hypothetical protein